MTDEQPQPGDRVFKFEQVAEKDGSFVPETHVIQHHETSPVLWAKNLETLLASLTWPVDGKIVLRYRCSPTVESIVRFEHPDDIPAHGIRCLCGEHWLLAYEADVQLDKRGITGIAS